MANKGDLNVEHMKKDTVTTKDGEFTRDTDMLDGMAKDSAVMDETNVTTQYSTPALDKSDLGGRNDPNG
jgi:hypothetical protein